MRAFVVFLTPSGEEVALGHGDLIGRLGRAALYLDDPRVSEAHAMVSLRGEALKLLALRGRLKLAGRQLTELTLEAGQLVELAPALTLRVEDVVLPDEVVGLRAPGLPPVALQGVLSFFATPTPRFEPGLFAHADLVVWGEEGAWRAAEPGQAPKPLGLGQRLTIRGLELVAEAIPLDAVGTSNTLAPDRPLRIVAHYDTAKVHHGDQVVLLAGVPARLISELVAIGGPASWEVLAHELWGGDVARDLLRTRFDMALSRLRKRLRAAHIRDDLVVSSGTGQVELVLHDGDLVEDAT
jgi:hypothetical protein